jgi:hypothetical protein
MCGKHTIVRYHQIYEQQEIICGYTKLGALDKKKPFQMKDNSSFKKRKCDKGKKGNVRYKKMNLDYDI